MADGAEISSGAIINLTSGTWGVHANINGVGTAKLLISVNGGSFTDIEGAAFSDVGTSFGGIVLVQDCRVRGDTTGDSKLIISKVNNR